MSFTSLRDVTSGATSSSLPRPTESDDDDDEADIVQLYKSVSVNHISRVSYSYPIKTNFLVPVLKINLPLKSLGCKKLDNVTLIILFLHVNSTMIIDICTGIAHRRRNHLSE